MSSRDSSSWTQTHLKDVRHGRFVVNGFFEHTVLIDTNRGQEVKDASVHGSYPIGNDGDHDPLPAWSTFLGGTSPVLGPATWISWVDPNKGVQYSLRFGVADIPDVEHHIVKCPRV